MLVVPKVVNNLYGIEGGFRNDAGNGLKQGVCDGITSIEYLVDDIIGIPFSNSFLKSAGNGAGTCFSTDTWAAPETMS